jgi:hypothetical protein
VSVHEFGDEPLCTPPSPISSWESYDGSLQDDLLAHYTFDNNYLDTSGNRLHVFEFGNPAFIDDAVSGQALRFDGVDDYLELPKISELVDFTITFWYRVSGDQIGKPAIIGNKDFRSASNKGWVISSNYGYRSNGDDLAINLSDGLTTVDSSRAMDVGLNTWHFVAVRIKRGNIMSLLRSDKGSYSIQEDSISTLTGKLETGNRIRIGTSHGECAPFTKMDLDDLGIWSRALSSVEVEQIWMAGRKKINLLRSYDSPNNRNTQTPSAMIAKYDFENSLVDSSSNALDASLLSNGGGMTFSSSTEGYMNLNNVDFQQKTYVTLPSSRLLDFGTDQPFTM